MQVTIKFYDTSMQLKQELIINQKVLDIDKALSKAEKIKRDRGYNAFHMNFNKSHIVEEE